MLQGVPVTAHQDVWFMHDDTPPPCSIFREMNWTRRTFCLVSMLFRTQSLGFPLGPPEIACVFDAGVYRRILRHGSSSLQLTSSAHRICLNASDNPSSVGFGCSMT
ncbi:hypothetical protein TNCV_2483711 [Trichonephila clavipes]|uniref:Uncharacterized protein n=1 Tax=Trichonephila clavipes TaxID=2585209 RepID=A0A8X6VZ85_TRICX|nr:hypothetical protein TNCV_2483711 [Trichonephila clavipes]